MLLKYGLDQRGVQCDPHEFAHGGVGLGYRVRGILHEDLFDQHECAFGEIRAEVLNLFLDEGGSELAEEREQLLPAMLVECAE